MAEIYKITLPSGTTYEIKDKYAREQISQIAAAGLSYTIVEELPTASETTMGVIYMVQSTTTGTNDSYDEFLTLKSGSGDTATYSWEHIGSTKADMSGYAKKGDGVTTSGTAASTTTGVTVGNHTVTNPEMTSTGSFTPQGGVSQPTFSGNSMTSTGSYTPAGTVDTPTVTVTLNTASKYVASSSTGGGSVTNGSAAQCSMPAFSATVANEILTISWTAGSFTANIPTAVTLPSFSSQTIASSVKSASASAIEFHGTAGDVSVSGTPTGTVSKPTFTGTAGDVSVSGTPNVSVSAHSVTDSGHSHTVSASGTINT